MAFQQQRSRPRVQQSSHHSLEDDLHPAQDGELLSTVTRRSGVGDIIDHSRSSHHPARLDASSSATHAQDRLWNEDDEVLLFGGSAAVNESSIYASAVIDQSQQWSLLSNPTRHRRNLSPSTTTESSQSSSNRAHGDDRRELSVSLFPAHDGNGRFLSLSSDSLIDSTTASQQDPHFGGGGGTTLSVHSWSDLDDGASSQFSASRRRTAGHETRDRHESSGANDEQDLVDDVESLNASWALTEAALSTIPDHSSSSRIRIRRSLAQGDDQDHGSAGFTSDSSADLDDNDSSSSSPAAVRRRRAALHRSATPKASSATFRRHRTNRAAAKSERQVEEAEEETLSRTPDAQSAGLHMLRRPKPTTSSSGMTQTYEDRRAAQKSSRSSREAYPSPPPEDLTFFASQPRSATTKRRHRQPGRSGSSQKRSSASGSVRPIVHSTPMPSIAQRLEAEQMMVARRDQAQDEIYLGHIVGSKFMDVDLDTLELVARAPLTPEATPTPSRATSPITTPKRSEAHGFEKLSRKAEREVMGPMFLLQREEDSEESEEEEGNGGHDTETEGTSKTTQWHSPATPLVFAPRNSVLVVNNASPNVACDKSTPPRSLSASSLPLYLANSSSSRALQARLQPLTTNKSANEAGRLRRTSSFSESDESPWGGEFDGLEAAIVYWRSFWRRIRGLEA